MSGLPAGCIIAGGRGRRMDGIDKPFVTIRGEPLVGHVAERLMPQVSVLALNANERSERFASFGCPIIEDAFPGYAGPLAGLLAAMRWSPASWIATAPCDTPFIPHDYVSGLLKMAGERQCAIARSGERHHPVCGVWRKELAELLAAALADGVRKMDEWISRLDCGIAEWPADPYDPFFNINRPSDIAVAERIVTEFHS